MAAAATSSSTKTTLIRGSIQGIVYFVNPANGHVYTFNPENPKYVGLIEKCTNKHLISKSDGALSGYQVKFRDDIKEVMKKLEKEESSETDVCSDDE
jgi:hypothetical protein